jgi:hypothetical protein
MGHLFCAACGTTFNVSHASINSCTHKRGLRRWADGRANSITKSAQAYGTEMNVEIRPDLQSVSQYLHRLIQYRRTFHEYNVGDWSHLKNQEDFAQVYTFSKDVIRAFESIYADGRDLAVFMSRKLGEFNDAGEYPTLKSYVDSFAGGWVYQIPQLTAVVEDAKSKVNELKHETPWSVGKMIQLFETQVEMVVQVGTTLENLKQSALYLEESGFRQNGVNLFEQILTCINNTGRMFERSPSAHIGKGEEALRDHILVTLGGALHGSVTGESFNKKGKTDILVRISGTNEFIGECKFWAGEEVYLSTIDQLFSYLGWRDNKAAVILFVENKNFDAVMEKIKKYTPTHPNFSVFAGQSDETWLSYEFKAPDNPNRKVQLAVMAYHLPK